MAYPQHGLPECMGRVWGIDAGDASLDEPRDFSTGESLRILGDISPLLAAERNVEIISHPIQLKMLQL